jgi:hypothetical protein
MQISDSSDQVFLRLKAKDSNNECFDCHTRESSWCSVNHGIFLCLKCAGTHRGFGVHISFVKSVSMDTWSHKHLRMMTMGGNRALSEFFESYGLASADTQQKYRTKAAYYYREMLKATVEGNTYTVPRPMVEEGRIVVEEEKRQVPKTHENRERQLIVEDKTHQIKEFVGGAIEKTKDFGKNIKEIVSDLTIKDVENSAKHAFNTLESKVESWDFKAKLKKVKDKTSKYYHTLTGSKNSQKKGIKFSYIDDSILEPNEDDLLLDPQKKRKASTSKL